MRKIIVFFAIIAYMIIPAYSAKAMGFNVNLFQEDERNGLFSIVEEEDLLIIDAEIKVKDRAFEHENSSKYYYSCMYTDLMVFYPETKNEHVVPRICIEYCTDEEVLNISTAEINFEKVSYVFDIEETNIRHYGDTTIGEEVVIGIGDDSAQMIFDWYNAAYNEEQISIILKGKSEEIQFLVPPVVNMSTGLLYMLYAEAGGLETLGVGYETPVKIIGIENKQSDENKGYIQYIDEESKVKFSVPHGWNIDEPKDSWKHIRASFEYALTDDDLSMIQYLADDIWGEIIRKYGSNAVRGMDRSKIDNSIYSKQDIAEMLGTSVADIQMVSYGGNEYYKTVVKETREKGGFSLSFDLVELVCIKNGYMYTFVFSGTENRFVDFEELLESVEYIN